MAIKNISQERLKELFNYDPATGIFTRLVRPSRWSRMGVGDAAGGINGPGYNVIQINEVTYSAHRLAFLYMRGTWPVNQIDHINGIRSDNRWENLREATWLVNSQNKRSAQRNNKVGKLGVRLHRGGKYQAQIGLNGKTLYLGLHPTAEAAHEAYLAAKRIHHPGCTI